MISFTKMHGLGNDFIVLDEFAQGALQNLLSSSRVAQWCDRRFGVGADQILVIGPPRASQTGVVARMDIWNADGSTAEMCGNGIRAVALYLHDHAPEGFRGRKSYRIETGAGVLEVFIEGREVRVNMGPPRHLADSPEPLQLDGDRHEFYEVSMGNPHAVFLLPEAVVLADFPVERLGPRIENHPRFPKKTNVEFVRRSGPNRIEVRVWERGAGITLACGTGACASAVAALHAGLVQRSPAQDIEVSLPGGTLRLAWDGKKTGPVWMTGPAVEVFSGTLG
jgi:diaminopimelate epimerase